jgi:hypothetical protein
LDQGKEDPPKAIQETEARMEGTIRENYQFPLAVPVPATSCQQIKPSATETAMTSTTGAQSEVQIVDAAEPEA